MPSAGINGEGKLRGQLANPGSPGKRPLKRSACVCVFSCTGSVLGILSLCLSYSVFRVMCFSCSGLVVST